MSASYRPYPCFVRRLSLAAGALGLFFLALPDALTAQSVPPALESPPVHAPQTGPHGENSSRLRPTALSPATSCT